MPKPESLEHAEHLAQRLARALDYLASHYCPHGWGFVAVLFSFRPLRKNDPRGLGDLTYVSNAEREGVIEMLENLLEELKSDPSGKGALGG